MLEQEPMTPEAETSPETEKGEPTVEELINVLRDDETFDEGDVAGIEEAANEADGDFGVVFGFVITLLTEKGMSDEEAFEFLGEKGFLE